MEVVTRKRKWDGETERWLERGKGQGYGGGREEKAQWRTGTCLSMGWCIRAIASSPTGRPATPCCWHLDVSLVPRYYLLIRLNSARSVFSFLPSHLLPCLSSLAVNTACTCLQAVHDCQTVCHSVSTQTCQISRLCMNLPCHRRNIITCINTVSRRWCLFLTCEQRKIGNTQLLNLVNIHKLSTT